MANKEAVTAVLTTIEENLDRWDQDVFIDEDEVCGTRMCFAGWALINAGYTVIRPEGPWQVDITFASPQGVELRGDDTGQHARAVLGLTYSEAKDIFYWFPESFVGLDVTKGAAFEAFKGFVLARLGMEEGK